MSPNSLAKLNKELSATQRLAIERIGFGSLLHLEITKIPLHLGLWLVQNFDPESRCLKVCGEEFYITENDVQEVFGLPLGTEHMDIENKCKDNKLLDKWKEQFEPKSIISKKEKGKGAPTSKKEKGNGASTSKEKRKGASTSKKKGNEAFTSKEKGKASTSKKIGKLSSNILKQKEKNVSTSRSGRRKGKDEVLKKKKKASQLVKIGTLYDHLVSVKTASEMWLRNYVVLCTSVLIVGGQNQYVNCWILRYLKDVNQIKNLNWCKYVVESLV